MIDLELLELQAQVKALAEAHTELAAEHNALKRRVSALEFVPCDHVWGEARSSYGFPRRCMKCNDPEPMPRLFP